MIALLDILDCAMEDLIEPLPARPPDLDGNPDVDGNADADGGRD
ncbi:hypothetical protein J2853_005505 [Streptosporangium lutulentum]|uniref:HTH cro/C1-type domain-containing protein n=1 Tax=Streptosporangium lutulentum TaxID=1461250 RepID=A0ABT9QK33_9ACTN|nr:hypothetical protein [Streptosporangium lutulentum]